MTLLEAAFDLHASALAVVPVATDGTIERFAGKVHPAPSGCWIWLPPLNGDGYGSFHLDGRKIRAHRAAWVLLVGAIPAGLELDHLCRVRRCVRPLHLDPVTTKTNLLRGFTRAAANAARTHCPHGHLYDEKNTLRKNGRRHCRACNRLDCARRRAAA